jgi:hypothetical protein
MLQYETLENGISLLDNIPLEYTSWSILNDSDRRRRRTESTTFLKETETVRNMHLVCLAIIYLISLIIKLTFSQRRRTQNRASQRAFRERKEKHVKSLEQQLKDLHEKHQDLLQSHTRQAGAITKLDTELQTLQSLNNQSFRVLIRPDKSDESKAFSGPDLFYNGSECHFDMKAVESNVDLDLLLFQDSL